MTKMKKPKCAICGDEIDEEEGSSDFIGASDDINNYYISSNEKMIGKEICGYDFEEEGEDGIIRIYRDGKSLPFKFGDTVVLNTEAYDESGFNTTPEEIKEICDIANAYGWEKRNDWRGYFYAKKTIGNLVRALSTYTGRDRKNDIKQLDDFLDNKWKKKAYYITTITSNVYNSNIDVYVEKGNKKEFIKELKENVSNTDEFDFD